VRLAEALLTPQSYGQIATMGNHDARQLSLFTRTVDRNRSVAPTLEQLRRMLRGCQIMRMNPSRPAYQRFALTRLEVWLRAMIKQRRRALEG
jgi:hypothetical protein